MVLVDTSVWVSHLRADNFSLKTLLYHGEVLCHPLIIGELSCGTIKNRKEIISLLQAIPQAAVAENAEVLQFIEMNNLMGLGLGFIDMHLLASARLSNSPVWSLDKKLNFVSTKFDLNFCP